MKRIEWSYEKINDPMPYFGTQKDWNQTIMVKINFLLVDLNNDPIIKVPKKLKKLIESLGLYNPTKNEINSLYHSKIFKVEFIESDNNIIYVGDSELIIQNYETENKYDI